MEPVNIRAKVARLAAYMDKKSVKEMPVNIDTRLKGIGFGYSITVFVFLITWLIVSSIDSGAKFSVGVSIGLIAIIELVNTVTIDAFHAEIEVITKRFKK